MDGIGWMDGWMDGMGLDGWMGLDEWKDGYQRSQVVLDHLRC